MITTKDYERALLSTSNRLNELYLQSSAYGTDLKKINDRAIKLSRDLYETCLKFKGQEEGVDPIEYYAKGK